MLEVIVYGFISIFTLFFLVDDATNFKKAKIPFLRGFYALMTAIWILMFGWYSVQTIIALGGM